MITNEIKCVETMMCAYPFDEAARKRIQERAQKWMSHNNASPDFVTQLLQGFPLDSAEGRTMMELAESYLRVEDPKLQKDLLHDKVASAQWHSKNAHNNISKLVARSMKLAKGLYKTPAKSLSAPVEKPITQAVMKKLAGHFVCGETTQDAVQSVRRNHRDRETYSFDMLGEGARTYEDAQRYFEAYLNAIDHIGNSGNISVKLSALHPHFEETHRAICFDDLDQKIKTLSYACQKAGIDMRIDAEEARRLDLMLDLIDSVSRDKNLKNWNGLGIAVQAYLKCTPDTIKRLQKIAKRDKRSMGVRLVKGAYWDTEIKYAQVMGHTDFPVFTRKVHTDLSYIHCAEMLLKASHLRPAFGSHNAMTLSAVAELARQDTTLFETQRLIGMGDHIHEAMRAEGYHIGVYAPVGPHKDLLPYLVRRLLENGANTSFLKQSNQDNHIALQDPYDAIAEKDVHVHPNIRWPIDLYDTHKNALAPDLGDAETCIALQHSIKKHSVKIDLEKISPSLKKECDTAFEKAHMAFDTWNNQGANARADILEKLAELLTKERDLILTYLQKEAGKTIQDAIDEWREAIDFCRYYASQARDNFKPRPLNSPEGETNTYYREGRGVFVTIAPWNFPFAIFLGQIVAALAAGNSVIAKPAEQTPHIGALTIKLAHKAGIPKDVLHLIQGGGNVGARLIKHDLCAGVAFTGSFTTGKIIQKAIAERDGAMIPFIAETAGLNAMVVDSSALPEQVIDDVLHSAFGSAGQRCSALRILIIDEKASDAIVPLLKNAIAALHVDTPNNFASDVGPIIDAEQAQMIRTSIDKLKRKGKVLAQASCDSDDQRYVAPIAIDMTGHALPSEEIFGPVLQIYRSNDLLSKVTELNEQGYALTFGLHTRLSSQIERFSKAVNAGNIYINRSMTGAVVGVQPFGGFGLSGTGPKAGGPYTLQAYSRERVITQDITAAGGNAGLVALSDTLSGTLSDDKGEAS